MLNAHEERLTLIRDNIDSLTSSEQFELRSELRAEVQGIRRQSGAIATNATLMTVYKEIRRQPGLYYLSKLYIDSKLFSQYVKVFPRWPTVKLHALVVFDPSTNERLNQLFEIEGVLYGDAALLLSQAQEATGGLHDFRTRPEADQRRLHTYLRSAAPVIFNFLEAYLNGLAYDCFHTHHNNLPIRDHDLLAEWDSQKKQTRFVSFDVKIFKYPRVVGRSDGKNLDLGDCKAAHFLAQQGKSLRDSVVHPSAFVHPRTGKPEKLHQITSLNYVLIEQLFQAAREYVETVEQRLGYDPHQTTPWLYLASPNNA